MANKPASKNKGESTTPRRLVLLDAHAILHRAYHALPDFSTRAGEPTGALYGLSTMLLKIIDDLSPDYLAACFDLPKPTHRHEVYADYKGTRAKTDAELIEQIKRSRDVFTAFGIPCYECAGFEADDLLGTIVEKCHDGIEIVIASGDMDTLQLVDKKRVRVYTLRKGIKDTIIYDEKAVRERYGFGPEHLTDYKGLCGDQSDNIIGIKGIGAKTATALITEFGSIENIYKVLRSDEEKLKQAGLTARIINLLKDNEEEALFSKMLATIRRDAPIDFKLPDETWQETYKEEQVLKLFDQLEFRALAARLQQKVPGGTIATAAATEKIDTNRVKRVGLALWLVNSEITNPGLEDIYTATRTTDFATAEKQIMADLEKEQLERVYREIELPLMPIVVGMGERGIAINAPYLVDLAHEYRAELEAIEKEIYELAGTEFNINSPKQLGEIIFDTLELKKTGIKKTATGARSTREEELQKLTDEHPIIGRILEYRELTKLLSTYIEPLPKIVAADGRLHAEFIQAGTTTGRMASQHPNLQNIPIRSARGERIRSAFVADPGCTLLAFDYSQIELRIAAWLSGDKKFLDVFRNQEDIHRAVAAQVFGISPEEITGNQRSVAKTINFGILYGMGVNALRKNLGGDTTQAQAKQFYEEYFAAFPTLTEYLEKSKRQAHKQGFTTTYFGRRRHFPDINSRLPHLRAAAERMAINAPIQGTQADIIKLAMVEINERLDRDGINDGAQLLLQVHDELIYEVKDEHVGQVAKTIREIMENIVSPEVTGGITFVANASAGPNWGELERVS
jgi:DNA polymerase-1